MSREAPLDPARPIVDPHLHLWEIPEVPGLPQDPQRFLLADALAEIAASGHAVTHSVFVECGQRYRADGPESLRSLGETEFAAALAAQAAATPGAPRLNHRILAHVDLALPDVEAVLDAHLAAAGERFRGVRANVAWSADGLWGFPCDPALEHRLADPAFIAGARALAARGLGLDVWCIHGQLGAVAALADAVPDLLLVLDHAGTPDRRRPERMADVRAQWQAGIAALAARPNTRIKLGGLGMDITRMLPATSGPASSEELAELWRPWLEPAIAAFGPDRAMFESNFPPDRAAGDYGVTWNAFKRIAAGHSEAEQHALFAGTAAATYRIG